jgi:hypothetical protein
MERVESLLYKGMEAVVKTTGTLVALSISVVALVTLVRVAYLHLFARRAEAYFRRV